MYRLETVGNLHVGAAHDTIVSLSVVPQTSYLTRSLHNYYFESIITHAFPSNKTRNSRSYHYHVCLRHVCVR